jgi:hypothetical protein
MLRQAQIWILTTWRAARPALQAVQAFATPIAKALWSVLRPLLSVLLQVVAALILIFEEWGWKPLADAMARLARFRPWAMAETWIASLPPYGALLVFALPTTILLPLKLFSVWLLANSYFFAAGALFIGAKIVSTALIARIFMLTQPALMRIGWFARAYNKFTPWKDALFARIRASYTWRYGRMIKTSIAHETKQAWARWKPWLNELTAEWRPRLVELAHRARVRVRILRQTWLPANMSALRANVRRTWQRIIGIG